MLPMIQGGGTIGMQRAGLLRILQLLDSWKCLWDDASHRDEGRSLPWNRGEFYDLANDPEEFFQPLGSSRRLEKKKRNACPLL